MICPNGMMQTDGDSLPYFASIIDKVRASQPQVVMSGESYGSWAEIIKSHAVDESRTEIQEPWDEDFPGIVVLRSAGRTFCHHTWFFFSDHEMRHAHA